MIRTWFTGFVIILITLICCALYCHFHIRKEKDYLDFFCVFSGSYALYSIVGAFDRINDNSFELSTHIMVYCCMIAGYISFAAGYHIISVKYKRVDHETRGKISFNFIHLINIKRSYRIVDLAFFALFFFFCFINYETISNLVLDFGRGTSYAATSARSARTVLSGPLALLGSFFMLFFIGFPFVRIYKNREVKLLDVIIFLLQASYSLASGHRASLLIIGIMFLAAYNYRVKHISLINLLVIVFAAMLAFVSIGHLRAASSISEMFNMLKGSNVGIFRVSNTGEFYNTVGTFFTYVESIGNGSYSFNYGYTWIVDILIFIPYFLFPGRPLPWAEQHMAEFHPEAPTGTGYGWYVLNDGYMSFGVVGIMVEMFIIGLLLARIYYFLRSRMDSPYIAYMYCMILSSVFLLSRGSFLGSVKNSFLEIIPLVFIYNMESLIDGKLRWKRKLYRGVI